MAGVEGRRVLVAAPFGRDAHTLAQLLGEAGCEVCICAGLDEVAERLDACAGLVLLAEEALAGQLDGFRAALARQPVWSDIPLLLLAARRGPQMGRTEAVHARLPDVATNIVVLERPLGAESLVTAVNSALRARRRQFQLRDGMAQIAQAAATLEEQVARRTAELQAELEHRERIESVLRQSQKMEAIGHLTGGIAHDFNNMLTGVIGSLDMIRRRLAAGRTEGLERYMDAATVSAQRAATLTQRLLAFSRRQSLDVQPTDVNDLIDGLGDLLDRSIDERIRLTLVCGPDLPRAVTDPNQLESAVLNLVINARDAMPNGGALTVETGVAELDEAYVAAHPGARPGRHVVVAVSDSGVGMEPELLDKVFEPFFTTKPLGQGTGLGLSMVYGFARQSGGHVDIDSRPGRGTTVSIYLPASDEPARTVPAPPRPAAAGQGQRVLLVEDDASVRLLVTSVLEELGYQTIVVGDPESAVPILQGEGTLDLLVSDVGLPGMTGRQLAEIARQHRPSLPILFITGYAENAAIRADFLGHNMAMITKPFTLDILAAKTAEMLNPAEVVTH